MPTQWSMPETWDAPKMVNVHWEKGNHCFLVKCSLNNRNLACTVYTVLTFKASANHELLMSHKLVRMLRAEERIGKLWSNAYVILSLSQIYWLWEFYSILSSILGYKICPYTPGVVCIQVFRVMRHEKTISIHFSCLSKYNKMHRRGSDHASKTRHLRDLKYRSTDLNMCINYGFIKINLVNLSIGMYNICVYRI